MDCSINEECLSYLHLLWEKDKIIEKSNKEQVILLFSLPATVVFILIAVLKICCLIIPIPQPEMWSVSFQFLVMSNSPFVFLPGAGVQNSQA